VKIYIVWRVTSLLSPKQVALVTSKKKNAIEMAASSQWMSYEEYEVDGK